MPSNKQVMKRKVEVCPNCNQVRLHRKGEWPCTTCKEPVKWQDGTQLKWNGTIAEVKAHQQIHDSGRYCAICEGDASTRTK